MGPRRRQTRQQHEEFMAKLDGKSPVEHLRFLTLHKQYLDGERNEDVIVDPLPAPTRTPARVLAPPRGKAASYAAAMAAEKKKKNAKPRQAAKATAPTAPAPGGKKKMTKKKAVELAREKKKAKEDRAVKRAELAATNRSAAKGKERERVAREEKEGVAARRQALDDLKRKRAEDGTVASKKKKKANPLPADESDLDEDNENSCMRTPTQAATSLQPEDTVSTDRPCNETPSIDEASIQDVARTDIALGRRICGLVPASNLLQEADDSSNVAVNSPRRPARYLTSELGAVDVARVIDSTEDTQRPYPANSDDLNSDIDDDVDSDDWYTETEAAVAQSEEGGSSAQPSPLPVEGELSVEKESDGGLDGNLLLARERNRAKRQLEKARLAAAMAKLSRDWSTTTGNWDTLTTDEMEVLACDVEALKTLRTDGWNFDETLHPEQTTPYPGLYAGDHGPTSELLSMAESPLRLLLFFIPPRLRRRIATESNRYYHQQLGARVERIHAAAQARGEDSTSDAVMLRETKRHKTIQPEELLHCIGLFIARMLCPHKRRLADHWATTAVGAVPKGTFGNFMSKARFDRIMQNLQFTNNADPRADTDRAWKVRSVVETLQRTFARGFKVPPVLSFDEAMIPSRSRHNVTRQFMKDKPHKWGTKLFMTCCASTAYCLRIEIFCGTDQHSDELDGAPQLNFLLTPTLVLLQY